MATENSSNTKSKLSRVHGISGVPRQLWLLKAPLVFIVAILAFLPLPLVVDGQEARCAYVMVVMSCMWLTEAVPIAVTALLPVFLFPMVGVLKAKDVGESYINNTSFLFFGGLVMAVAVEESNLHKRVALNVLRLVGTDPKWIMLGLMLPTWFLSMWISNTAAVSMMIPIVEAVLEEIKMAQTDIAVEESSQDTSRAPCYSSEEIQLGDTVVKNKGSSDLEKVSACTGEDPNLTAQVIPQSRARPTDRHQQQRRQQIHHTRMSKGLSLCIAYAGNIGGIATLTGTPPNLVLKGQADSFFNKSGASDASEYGLTFLGWMLMAAPLSCLLLVVVWLWLVLLFLRGDCCRKNVRQMAAVKKVILRELEGLGSVKFDEIMTSVLFGLLVILWLSRDPKFITGWSVLFKDKYMSDATAAMLVAVLFFIFPKEKPNLFCWRPNSCDDTEIVSPSSYQPLLTWSTVEDRLPWGVIVLLGGGFALAKACKESGLSELVGSKLSQLDSLDPWILNLVICIIVAMATEVTSNTATATLLMPIMAELAVKLKVNPLYLMSSSALSTSFAFMMPVATPPNAIVFSHGRLTISDMVKAGALMNVFAVLLLTFAVNTWGDAIFDFSTLPHIFLNQSLNNGGVGKGTTQC